MPLTGDGLRDVRSIVLFRNGPFWYPIQLCRFIRAQADYMPQSPLPGSPWTGGAILLSACSARQVNHAAFRLARVGRQAGLGG